MNVTFTSKEVAEAIATQVADITGKHCEAFHNDATSVVICNKAVIARITPLLGIINIAPVGGTFDDKITGIPMESHTIDTLREIAHTIDETTANVLSAAMAH